MRLIILFAFALSGAAALIYEVAWTRALSLILGSTTYALSTMLSTFMAGLAIGGFIGGRVADRAKNLPFVFGLVELFIAFFGLITMPLINAMPPLYLKIYRSFHLSPSVYFFFQFLICAGIMLVPTTLMGATFPIVSKRVTDSIDNMGRWVGNAYSFNTFGAILGSFSAGFLLIPLAGVSTAAVIAAILNMIVAIVMIASSKVRLRGAVIAAALVLMSAPLTMAVVSQEKEWYLNYYSASKLAWQPNLDTMKLGDELVFDRDCREGRVKLWKSKGYLVLQTGGKVEGSTPVDMANTVLLAYLPIASHPGPRSFLNIGLGAGVTVAAAVDHIEDLSLVEINECVVEAIRQHGPPQLLDQVRVTINDARNFLLLSDGRYDIISSEPSYPTEASTANLFTREFYALAAQRLAPGGIFCQWLPYYMLASDDVTMMIRTFASTFDHIYVWKIEHSRDLIMVGSREPFRYGAEEIMKRVETLNILNFPLPFVLSKSPEEIRQIVAERTDIRLNTDDTPFLEFRAAKSLITGSAE